MAFYGNRSAVDRLVDKTIPVPEAGCWLWTGAAKPSGYGNFYLERAYVSAHRASYMLHVGPVPEGMCVCHKCDTPSCVNPDHLFLGTSQDNSSDMVAKQRCNPRPIRGERHHQAKLTASDVAMIRASDRPTQELADQLGVIYQTVWQVRRGMSWREAA